MVQVTPASEPPPWADRRIELAGLGRPDQVVSGVGDQVVSFSLDAPPVGGRATVPFEVVISHSGLLDRARSSFRLVLNDRPLASVALRELTPERAVHRSELPAAALRAGLNAIRIELTLRLPRIADAGATCAVPPIEQAWAVVHANSGLVAPAGDPAITALTLSTYPFPLVREGRLDRTLIVVPAEASELPALARLAAGLGRTARTGGFALEALRAPEFTAARAAGRDVVLWGRPEENPLIGSLGGRLPIQVDENVRLVLSSAMTVAVRDTTQLGVVQVAGSPWDVERGLLVATGAGADALKLASEALLQGGLAGTAALVSHRVEQPAAPGVTPTPQPLVLGAPLPLPVQVTTYQLRPAAAPPARHTPVAALVAAASGVLAVVITGLLSYAAYGSTARGARPRR